LPRFELFFGFCDCFSFDGLYLCAIGLFDTHKFRQALLFACMLLRHSQHKFPTGFCHPTMNFTYGNACDGYITEPLCWAFVPLAHLAKFTKN